MHGSVVYMLYFTCNCKNLEVSVNHDHPSQTEEPQAVDTIQGIRWRRASIQNLPPVCDHGERQNHLSQKARCNQKGIKFKNSNV